MFNYMNPNEIASQLMNSDDQLQSHLIEMKRLQDKLYSLELMSNQSKQHNAYSNSNSTHNSTSNNSEIASVGSAICQLSNQIDERKNILKNDLFHSYEMFSKQQQQQTHNKLNQQFSGSNYNSLSENYNMAASSNFNTSIEKQRLSASNSQESEYNSMVYPIVSGSNTSNQHLPHHQQQQQQKQQQQIQQNSVNSLGYSSSINSGASTQNKFASDVSAKPIFKGGLGSGKGERESEDEEVSCFEFF
jgi:hypothetical protein